MSCGIYKFENNINHKVYIGMTIDLDERYKKHCHNISDKNRQEDLYIDLRKYGLNNFTYEILEQFDVYNQEKLSQLENYYINKYNSLKPYGYNMVPGGYNGSGLSKGKSVEQYDLMGQYVATYPSAHEAARQTNINYSSICACAREEIEQVKGYQWKYTTSNKIIKQVIPKHIIKTVYQFSQDGTLLNEYDNLTIASKTLNIAVSLISLACSHPTRKAGGYYWSYDKNYQIPNIKLQGNGKKKTVKQYDKNNNFIAEYNSLKEASLITHINSANIGQVCAGKRKTAGGFIWKYK